MASVLQTIRSGGTQHPEELLHFFQNRVVLTSGTFDKDSNHFLVEESDTPAMSVDVRQGYAFIRKDASITFPAWLNTEDATVAITSNSSGNSRIDAIVLYIDLGASPNSAVTNVAKLVAVAGTPAGSPTAPDNTAILASIGASNPYIRLANVTVASGATSIVDANIGDQRTDATYSSKIGTIVGADGWISYSTVTPTRASADDPTYVLTFAGVDLTTTIYPGMRIKWTQNSTVRYAIVTKMAFSTDTTMTVYGGTDYDVDDTGTYAISAFNYSTQKAPAGFPLSPIKWTYSTNSGSMSGRQEPATGGTWYNLGAFSFSLPIGVWNMRYISQVTFQNNSADGVTGYITISTANNTQSNSESTVYSSDNGKSAAGHAFSYERKEKNDFIISLTSKTTHYLNFSSPTTITAIDVGGYVTYIYAVCAYL